MKCATPGCNHRTMKQWRYCEDCLRENARAEIVKYSAKPVQKTKVTQKGEVTLRIAQVNGEPYISLSDTIQILTDTAATYLRAADEEHNQLAKLSLMCTARSFEKQIERLQKNA